MRKHAPRGKIGSSTQYDVDCLGCEDFEVDGTLERGDFIAGLRRRGWATRKGHWFCPDCKGVGGILVDKKEARND